MSFFLWKNERHYSHYLGKQMGPMASCLDNVYREGKVVNAKLCVDQNVGIQPFKPQFRRPWETIESPE